MSDEIMLALCRWRANIQDNQLAERHYEVYYRAKRDRIRSYIEWKLGDPEIAEDYFQEICINLVKRLDDADDIHRPQILDLLSILPVPRLGAFIEKRITGWIEKTCTWALKTEQFYRDYGTCESESDCAMAARTLNDELGSVRKTSPDLTNEASIEATGHAEDLDIDRAKYTSTSDELFDLLPRLQIPLRSYLYKIADNRIQDHYRKIRRTPVESLQDKTLTEDQESHSFTLSTCIGGDCIEQLSLVNDIESILAIPVKAAEKRLSNAVSASEILGAEKNLTKQKKNFVLRKRILELKVLANESQEEIGLILGLTREQVKYQQQALMQQLEDYLGMNFRNYLREQKKKSDARQHNVNNVAMTLRETDHG